jgi:hypothetical protein
MNTSRRSFLKRSVTASAVALAGPHLGYVPWSRALGANDEVRLAVVGLGSKIKVGGKGKQDIRDFRKVPGVRIVALCDVDTAHLDPEVAEFKKRNEKVEAYTDVRKLLESKEIDAVSVTTPNHWHALVTIWACQAGKDVFVQKPASHNIFEGRKMVEAARKYKRIVLCTSGSREANGFQEAMDFVRQGGLGKLVVARGLNYRPRTSIGKAGGPQPIPATLNYDLWSGPAPVVPVNRLNLHYDWHWNWHYGNGDLGNMGIHNMDGCRMAVGDTLPKHAISIGGRFGYDDDGQTPNTQLMFFDYEPAPIIFEVRGLPKDKSFLKDSQVGKDSWGAKAMDEYLGVAVGKVIHCENGYVIGNQAFDKDGKKIKEFKPATPNLNLNFIQAVRSRRTGDLVADILQGHLSAALVHLGNISHRIGKTMAGREISQRIQGRPSLAAAFDRLKAHLDANGIDLDKTPAVLGAMLTLDPATERFVGEFSEAANPYVTREYRAPFIVPEQV